MLAIVLVFGFTVLGWMGSRIDQHMPPSPDRIVTSDGRVVASEGAITRVPVRSGTHTADRSLPLTAWPHAP
jgi:nitric oxide reductase large subunit